VQDKKIIFLTLPPALIISKRGIDFKLNFCLQVLLSVSDFYDK